MVDKGKKMWNSSYKFLKISIIIFLILVVIFYVLLSFNTSLFKNFSLYFFKAQLNGASAIDTVSPASSSPDPSCAPSKCDSGTDPMYNNPPDPKGVHTGTNDPLNPLNPSACCAGKTCPSASTKGIVQTCCDPNTQKCDQKTGKCIVTKTGNKQVRTA